VSRTHFIALLLAAVSATAPATPVHAVQRTHVSAAIGADANTATNCTPAAPCRTFQAAMTVTDSNGEVVVLDSGGYGAVNITQSVSLIAPTGVYAGISVFPGANGVTIATPDINVVLRGLSINGQGGKSGIIMTEGNKLTVENCVISNLNSVGIGVTGSTTVRITDTIIRDNGGDGVSLQNGVRGTITRVIASGNNRGIFVGGSIANTLTTADIADSIVNENNAGILATSLAISSAAVKVSVRDSRIARNNNFGLSATSFVGGPASLSATNNIVWNNRGGGISASGTGSKVWASGNTVSDNISAGFKNDGGAFDSAGNNAVRNNGTDTQGTITPVATK
jgi:Right handed beta helix region